MEQTHVSAADLKVADLKKELEKRGLSKSGNKAQLIERLQKCLEKEGQTLDSLFGAQVCAQKSNAAISGLDMARWCSQIVKKDSTTPTTPSAQSESFQEHAVSPVVSPTPEPIQTPQPQQYSEPQYVDSPVPEPAPVVNNVTMNNTNHVVVEETFHVPVMDAQPAQYIDVPQVDLFEQEYQQQTPLVEFAPAAPVAPVESMESAPADILPPQETYNEPLLLESDARGASPLLDQQEQDKLVLSDDERDDPKLKNSRFYSKPQDRESRNEHHHQHHHENSAPPEPVVPRVPTIDLSMLIPRRQLRMTEERLANRGVVSDGARKRKWSEEVQSHPPAKGAIISSESLKQMNLPDVSDVEEDLAGVDNSLTSPSGPRRRRLVVAGEQDSAGKHGGDLLLNSDGDDGNMMVDNLDLAIEEKMDDLAETDAPQQTTSHRNAQLSRKITPPNLSAPLVSLEVDEPRRVKREVSPARSQPTIILHIENLVRPFSNGQLKELLSKSGKMDESLFWIDKVKSHCIVGYQSVEDAIKTREALHGAKWPSTNPKILTVDFATPELLERYKSMEEGSTRLGGAIIGGVGMTLGGAAARARLVKGSQSSENGNAEAAGSTEERTTRLWKAALNGNGSDAIHQRQRLVKTVDNSNHRDEESGVPLRDRQISIENGAHRQERRKRDEQPAQDQQDQAAEASKRVSLDDLFRRTKTSPHLYWLPLTEEEITRREAERAARKQQREREQEQRDKEQRERERERERDRPPIPNRPARQERDVEDRDRPYRQPVREMPDSRRRPSPDRRRPSPDRGRRPSPDRGRPPRDEPPRGRRPSPDQSRGRRPSPERAAPIAPVVPAALATFRDPVTPPPFKQQKSRSPSSASSKSRSRSSSSSSSSSSGSSSGSSSRSRSRSSADSRDNKRR